MLTSSPFTFDRVFRIAIFVVVIWLMINLVAYLSDVLIPFAIALLLAYIINPLTSWLQKKLPFRGRLISVLLSLTIILSIVVLVLLVLVPVIVAEVANMRKLLATFVDTEDLHSRLQSYMPLELRVYISDILKVEELIHFLNFENIKVISQQVLPGIWGVFSGTISFVVGLTVVIIILLYLVFILLHFDEISSGWKSLIPAQYKPIVLDVISDFTTAMQAYFRAQAVIAFIVGLLFAIGFWLINLPMGIFLGLIIGLLNMVPYLQIVGVIPAIIIGLIASLGMGESIWPMQALIITVFVVVQVIQDAVLVPKIMGKVTGFNPAVILLSLSIWGKLLGILGLIIALPVTFLINSYYRRFIKGLLTGNKPN